MFKGTKSFNPRSCVRSDNSLITRHPNGLFQSTLLREERQYILKADEQQYLVSIHAPA
jgi:hypothetical protein